MEMLNTQQGSLLFKISKTGEIIAGVSLCSPRYVPRKNEIVTIANNSYRVEDVNYILEPKQVYDVLVYIQNIEILVELVVND